MIYIIVDGEGNELGGVSTNEDEIARWAQAKANDLGESVWYCGGKDEDAVSVEVEPNCGTLHRYEDAVALRPATTDEQRESREQAERDGGAGVILVDDVRCYVVD